MAGDDSTHRARKSLGQHFLADRNIIANIVRAIAPQQKDHMVEIGPGLGALTQALLPQLTNLHVVEIDPDVLTPLQSTCANLGELNIHHQDVLSFDFSQFADPIRVVGNLPYNISSPLIFHLLEAIDHIIDMHFMLQKEVVDRMAATPSSKNYGRLSVMVQYFCDVESLFTVKPGAFRPPPKVDSAVVRLIPHPREQRSRTNPARLSRLVKAAFAMRRKTLRNNLKGIISEHQFEAAGINPQWRAENLNVEAFVQLANVDNRA